MVDVKHTCSIYKSNSDYTSNMCFCGMCSCNSGSKSVGSQSVENLVYEIVKPSFPCGEKLSNRRCFRRASKILLIGSSGCGKSTVIKKLRMRFGRDISSREKEETRLVVYENIYSALACAIRELQAQGRLLDNADDGVIQTFWSNQEFGMTQSRWNCELLLSMRELCHRAIVLATALRFINPESYLRMFLSSYSHVLQPEWNPTETDVIQCYVPTKSLSGAWISKDLIALEANTKHTTQKELSKIMPLVDGIVCVADISTLDYRYMVDPGKSQFNESLGLLEEVLSSRGPQRKPIQLLLNKTDILRRKLKHLGVSLYSEGGLLQYFPGSAESVAKCFKEHLGYCDEYYLREICALDATWMNHIFKVWREMMFKSKLLAAGVM
ncbi:hypothetical protein CBS147333_10213 [Penicillium roqueforti]|nr:hypothetical protein CBS147333_10213 [Penicillium roqueforti]KAI3193972.1 hypothetical protein CBS147311_8873 [Penicillium roqueforti]KAI3271588.1 hypothetical protein CBS147308_4268 [Penicillium roqueforti]KAI3276420.1 hypothetical protein DTO003C3_10197 [Penicillium roqueforti]KAI3289779.1 hypothetical protein DTO002I6_6656 [Penicillium roqueforti]